MAKKIRSGRMTYSIYIDIDQREKIRELGKIVDMNKSAIMRSIIRSGLEHYDEWLPPATVKAVKKKLGGK